MMHYRSGLNMIPLIEWYRANPDEGVFLLEVAMGAISGQMANIDADGATSMMFHVVPHVMDFDPPSGDFGLGFFGNALEGGAYFVRDAALGELCYLCELSAADGGGARMIEPKDGYRIALYLEPLGLYAQSECGTFASATLDEGARTLAVEFTADSAALSDRLRLKLTKTAPARPGSGLAVDRAALARGASGRPPAGAGPPPALHLRPAAAPPAAPR